MFTLSIMYLWASRLGAEIKPSAFTDKHKDSPSTHPPAFFQCENMIPSPSFSSSSTNFWSLSLLPCCSVLQRIRKNNITDVHSYGTPRSHSFPLPVPLLHHLWAFCSHSRPFLLPGPWIKMSQVTNTPHRWSKAIKKEPWAVGKDRLEKLSMAALNPSQHEGHINIDWRNQREEKRKGSVGGRGHWVEKKM